MLFCYTGYVFLQPSKVKSQYIPPEVILDHDSNCMEDIMYNYQLCDYLNQIAIDNDATIKKRIRHLKISLFCSVFIPLLFLVIIYLHL